MKRAEKAVLRAGTRRRLELEVEYELLQLRWWIEHRHNYPLPSAATWKDALKQGTLTPPRPHATDRSQAWRAIRRAALDLRAARYKLEAAMPDHMNARGERVMELNAQEELRRHRAAHRAPAPALRDAADWPAEFGVTPHDSQTEAAIARMVADEKKIAAMPEPNVAPLENLSDTELDAMIQSVQRNTANKTMKDEARAAIDIMLDRGVDYRAYPSMCLDRLRCWRKGYCPREHACDD